MRYHIVEAHGAVADYARVVDRKTGRVMGTGNSYWDGPAYLKLAEIQCNALNKADFLARHPERADL